MPEPIKYLLLDARYEKVRREDNTVEDWALLIAYGITEIRDVFNMPTRFDAEIQLKKLIEKYGKTAPDLSSWLENELPEGFTVFNVEPDSLNARRKLRTTNMVEFQNKELKKRTRCIRVFPNKESLLRIATALLIELDEKWLANGKVYLKG